jgi:hypothetical protein
MTERSKILQKQQKDIEKYLQSRNKLRDNIQLKTFGDIFLQQDAAKLFNPITKTQEETTNKAITSNQESTNKILANLKDNQDVMNKQLLSLTSSLPKTFLPSLKQDSQESFAEQKESELESESKKMDLDWVAPQHLKQYTNPKRTSDMYFLQNFKSIEIYKMNKSNYVFDAFTLNKLEADTEEIEKKYTVDNSVIDLLFHPDPTLNKTSKEDIKLYFKIRDESGYVRPTGKENKKTKAIEKKYHELIRSETLLHESKLESSSEYEGDGLSERLGSTIRFLPSDTKQLVERLLVLLGSDKGGNNNVRNESFAIMDMLLKQNKLSKHLYTKIVNEFFS